MFSASHVFCHDIVVRPVKQELAEQLDALPLCHVGIGEDEDIVVPREERIKVCGEIRWHDGLVSR